MAEDTIFGKIIRKEIPAHIVFESENVVAFRDINPQAPTHIIVVPRKAIRSLSEATGADKELLGEMMLAVADIARSMGLVPDGYRVVVNNGPYAGQSVLHLHIHLLGGRPLGWPPG